MKQKRKAVTNAAHLWGDRQEVIESILTQEPGLVWIKGKARGMDGGICASVAFHPASATLLDVYVRNARKKGMGVEFLENGSVMIEAGGG